MNPHICNRQDGATLITALIFMVMLTMLALSSMSTNTLEERMAANSQEINRAFQAAESGLEAGFDDNNAFSVSNTEGSPYTDTIENIGVYGADAAIKAVYRQATPPGRGSGWDNNFAFYHFDVASTGATKSGAATTIRAGAYQVGSKPQ